MKQSTQHTCAVLYSTVLEHHKYHKHLSCNELRGLVTSCDIQDIKWPGHLSYDGKLSKYCSRDPVNTRTARCTSCGALTGVLWRQVFLQILLEAVSNCFTGIWDFEGSGWSLASCLSRTKTSLTQQKMQVNACDCCILWCMHYSVDYVFYCKGMR